MSWLRDALEAPPPGARFGTAQVNFANAEMRFADSHLAAASSRFAAPSAAALPGGVAFREEGRGLRVGDHEVGEVRGAEVRGQPEVDLGLTALDFERGDKVQIGYGLVELGVPDAREGAQDLVLLDHPLTSGFSLTSKPVSWPAVTS